MKTIKFRLHDFFIIAIIAAAFVGISAVSALAADHSYNISDGNISIVIGTSTAAVTYSSAPAIDIVPLSDNIIITGTSSSSTVAVSGAGTANITLNNAQITSEKVVSPFQISANATVKLTLTGTNTLIMNQSNYAALDVAPGATLMITSASTGHLTANNTYANSAGYSAGIGVGNDTQYGTIIINGGTITAASTHGAGIGGYCAGGIITINGGTISATGEYGAGIGGGDGYSNTILTINGGTITAKSVYGAGIGGGRNGWGGSILINGGNISALGSGISAGIGGGEYGGGGTVTINGGTVKATGLTGLGNGYGNYDTSAKIINGGSVSVDLAKKETQPKNSSGTLVYKCPLQIPDILTPTPAQYSIDGGKTYIPFLTDSSGYLYLWLPVADSVTVDVLVGTMLYQATGKVTVSGGTFTGHYILHISAAPAAGLIYSGSSQTGYTAALLDFGNTVMAPSYQSKLSAVYYSGNTAGGTALSGAPSDAGTYTVLVSFNAPSGYYADPVPVTFQIAKADTSIALAVGAVVTAVPGGYQITLTATVSNSSGGGHPDGTVAFSNGSDTLGSSVLTSGQAIITAVIQAETAYTLTANYSGNTNFKTAVKQINYSYELPPSVIINTTAPNPTNTSPIPVTVTFSKNVADFTESGIKVSNGSVSGFTGAGKVYTMNVTPKANGAVTVDVAAGVAHDTAGNANTAAPQLSVTYDATAPTVIISTTAGALTNKSPIPVTVTFSKNVADFTEGGIKVSNGTVSDFIRVGKVYTMNVTPTADGAVTIDVAAGAAHDTAGNANTAASQLSVTYDATAPTVEISTSAGALTNTSPIPVTVTFSKSVADFTESDLTVANGTVSDFIGVGKVYTMKVTPKADGAVTVDVAAGVAHDTAGNANTAASQLSVTYDATAPTVIISTSAGALTNTSPIPVTVTFSKNVTDFTESDVTVTNGTVSDFIEIGKVYTMNVTPKADGAVTVDVAAGVAHDAAGNANTAAAQLSVTYDATAPTVEISTSAGALTNTSPIPVTVTFSKSVADFTESDVTVTNGTVSDFIGVGNVYTMNVTPMANGAVTFDVAAGVAHDTAGNANTAAVQLSVTYDTAAPTVIISTSAGALTNTSPIPVTVTFSKNVTDFTESDVTVANGTASDFIGVGKVYTMKVTPKADGAVTVDVAAGVAHDAAGNANTAAAQLSVTYDATAPTVEISTSAGALTNTSPIPVTVTFSEDVADFTESGIKVSNGSVSDFIRVGKVYTMNVTPMADGAVTVDVAASVAHDTAGNANTAASQLSVTYDATAPTVIISTTAGALTNKSPIPVTVTFSEDVADFTESGIKVSNGSVSDFIEIGKVYSMNVTPMANGAVTVDVAAGVAHDTAGNANTAAAQLSVTYDTAAPTVIISTSAGALTNTSPIPVTVTFSKSVADFTESDITVANGTASDFIGVGKVYTMKVTPMANGAVTVNVAAGVAHDTAGNANTAALQLSVTYDTAAPTVEISTSAGALTNTSPIPVTVTFSKSVADFTESDLTVANGTVSDFIGVGKVYTMKVTPKADGAVTVDVAAGVAHDTAGNANTAASQLSVTYDATAPTVIISTSAGALTNTSPIPVTVTFSKSVADFTESDITVANGTVSDFIGVGKVYTMKVTPKADGAVTVDVAAGVAHDTAGNANTAAVQLSVTYDTAAPTVIISTSAGALTNTSPIPVTVTFSKSVADFTESGITVANGTASDFIGVGKVYTMKVTPMANGAVTVDVAAGVAHDAAGNANTAAAQLSVTYDAAALTVMISTTAGNPTNISPIPVTVTFSKNVADFSESDITAANGTLSGFTGIGKVYTLNVTPTTNGAVTVDIPAGAAHDTAGNANAAATQLNIIYNSTAPGISKTSLSLDVGGSDSFEVTLGSGLLRATSASIYSDNSSAAAVSADMVTSDQAITVNAIAAGTVKITVLFNDAAGTKKTVTVTVSEGSHGHHHNSTTESSIVIDNGEDYGNGRVRITISYAHKSYEDPNKVVAYYIMMDSGLKEIEPYCVYDATTGIMTIRANPMYSYQIEYNDVSFHDVTDSAWYKHYVDFLAARDVVHGFGNGIFAPDGNITRAQFVMILKNTANDNVNYTTSSFSDVGVNEWYSSAVEWAYENGIAFGANGKFDPDAKITRQDISAMIVRYAGKYEGYTFEKTKDTVDFTDSKDISSYAADSIRTLQQAGILDGPGDGTFRPLNNATRAEAAKMLDVLIRLMVQ